MKGFHLGPATRGPQPPTSSFVEAERICDRVAILNTKLITIGSPAELERKFGPGKTEVQLERVNQKIVNAVRRLKRVKSVETARNKLLINTDDPEVANPTIIETIVKRGGRVLYVTRTAHALEEAYLRLVRESEE